MTQWRAAPPSTHNLRNGSWMLAPAPMGVSSHSIQKMLYYGVVKTLSAVEVMARFGKALADPTRAAVLLQLQQGPAVPSELAARIGVSRQILSNHLACLRDCGLVVGVPVGRNVRYELSDPKLAHALEDLLDTILTVEPVCRCATPECAAEDVSDGVGSREVVA